MQRPRADEAAAAGGALIRFSTLDHRANERLEAFKLRINTMFDMNAPIERARDDFSGQIVSVHTGTMLVSAMETEAFEFSRPRRRILADHLDHIMLRVDLDGAWNGGGRPYGLTVFDLGQPVEPARIPQHNISVVLPRRVLAEAGLHGEDLHGQDLRSAPSLFLAEHVASLMRHAEGIEPSLVTTLADMTPALIAACLKPSVESQARARREVDLLTLERVRATIRANLYNPELGPAFLQRKMGLSRPSLYRLFEPVGGVAVAIRQARLRQALRDISAMEPGARLADIGHALGFSSEAHFSRAFRNHYGCAPREARALLVRNLPVLSTGALLDAERRFPEWLQAL